MYIFYCNPNFTPCLKKKSKIEQTVKCNRGLPLLGVMIDFSILIWSIVEIEFQKIEKKSIFYEPI